MSDEELAKEVRAAVEDLSAILKRAGRAGLRVELDTFELNETGCPTPYDNMSVRCIYKTVRF